MLIHTIGHSNRTLDEFLKILGHYQIELLLDVRTVPRSRHVPHFNSDALRGSLQTVGIEYCHLKRLGGLRKPLSDSLNTGWRNASFRGFADYIQTDEFRESLDAAVALASGKKAALMCAEAVPWRCHRSLIGDALLVRRAEVMHIISEASLQLHELTSFAVIEGEGITYPKAKEAGSRSLF